MLLTTLRDYQKEGVKKALQYDGFAFFNEQRTGKCLMAIAVMDARQVDRVLIVCPLKAILTWEKQLKLHWKPNPKPEIELISFGVFQRQRHWYKKWIKASDRSIVIVDEGHRIKNRGTKQSQACKLIGRYARFRLLLTGTPMTEEESIEDAWAQLNFVQPGVFGPFSDRLDRTTKKVIEEGFKSKYLIMGGFKGKKVVGYQKATFPEFQKIFHTYSYRVRLREVREKPLIIRKIRCRIPMSANARRISTGLENELRAIIRGKKIIVPKAVNLGMKLQQITGGFILPNTLRGDQSESKPIRVGDEKITALRHFLASSRLHIEKTVICAKFIHEIEAIGSLCKGLRLTYKTIQGGIEYDGKFDTDVLIVQIQAGIAMDLSESKTIVWYSWDYSYVNHEQMKFRVLSYDVRQILYYYLIIEDSIDEVLYEAIASKKKLADLICDHYRRK